MKDYLKEDVVDYTITDIENEIRNFPKQSAQENLLRIYRELKFYSNNEFAFKEIYNEKLFNENAKVLEEIIRLFQPYKFKYNKKAQFLGDFFELMLETGYKQSEGQFFTPTPIAKYIIFSIPLDKIIEEKIANKEQRFLPTVIDFACGSGHFLTEAIEEIQDLIQNIDPKHETEYEILKNYRNNTIWAGDYIYGIEKDYRLARTTQVACFMHGDGDANIIFGDGLEKQDRLLKDGSYDVLIANPPYTIKDFKKHLNVRPKDYELWNSLTIDSDDIEVLFIERMKQLLSVGGMAGIILPSSILSNSGVYTKAREIILQHFEIIAITEFGGITFGATSTNTVTLFLKKRHNDFVKDCGFIADDFILNQNGREYDFVNSEQLFKNYISLLNIDFEAYQTFINRKPNKEIKETDFYKNYLSWFEDLTIIKNHKKKKTFKDLTKDEKEKQLNSMFLDLVLEIERDKFYNFLLTHRLKIEQIDKKKTKKSFVQQKILIVKAGNDNATQKAFLGYSFSDRRGYKGIATKPSNKMYDPNNQLNPAKVNSYIYNAFVNEPIPDINEELAKHLKQVNLVDCINFVKIDFDKRFNLSAESNANPINYKWNTKAFGNILLPINGDETKVEKNDWKETGDYPVISQEKEFVSGYTSNVKPITDLPLIIFGDHTTIFKYIDFKFVRGADGVKLFKPNDDFLPKAFYYICQTLNIEASQKYTRHYKYLKNIQFPIPDKKTQKLIIKEIETIEKKEEKVEAEIDKLKTEIYKSINLNTETKAILDLCTISTAKENPTENPEKDYNYIGLEHIESKTSKFLDWQNVKGVEIKSTKNIFKKGQLLYGKLRPYLNKVVIANFDGICSTDILVLDTENPKILKYILLDDDFVKQASDKMSGVSLPRIKVKDFLNLQVSYPKRTEIEKVNKTIKNLETKIKKLEQSISNTKTEKKEILKKYLEE
jgi:type I restriction enzyme M protein